MIVKKLKISNLKAYSESEFEFQPGMNLLVGVNGVGKTTALEALRICLSHILPGITASSNRKENFTESDIKIENDHLQIICDFEISYYPVNLQIELKRKENNSYKHTVKFTPDLEILTPRLSLREKQPNGIFFSTRRSLMVDREPTKGMIARGQSAAFSDALSSNREFNLRIFTDWIRSQIALGKEDSAILKSIEVLKNAIYHFLPGFSNLQLKQENGKYTFTIDKENTTLTVTQLSDGERGILSLVMDIARRLYLASPNIDDPLCEGNAIILIDELDLHLHPSWQRSIIPDLIRTFPNCQFIATSHSPQIIPALEPERIHIINSGEIIHPDRSLGMDTNWILKYLMEAHDRPDISAKAIAEVEQLIDEVELDEALEKIASWKKEGLDLPEWSVFEARIARFQILDNEK